MKEKKTNQKVYDFTCIPVELRFDVFTDMDLSKQIANTVHMGTNDIGLDDLARELYHHGKISFSSEDLKSSFLAIVMGSPLIIAVKSAIQKMLSEK